MPHPPKTTSTRMYVSTANYCSRATCLPNALKTPPVTTRQELCRPRPNHPHPTTLSTTSNLLPQAREVQSHLSALRSLCRGLLEKIRTGPDPLEGARIDPVGGAGSWRKVRAENRLLALRGRDEFIAREERCVMCMVNVRSRAQGAGRARGGAGAVQEGVGCWCFAPVLRWF